MEVRLQKIGRMGRKDRCETYFLILATIEDDEHLCGSAASVFESMAVAHGSKTDVAGAEFHYFRKAVGRKDSEADLARKYVLPFIRVRVPVEFTEAAGS